MVSPVSIPPALDAALILADGSVFYGVAIGKPGKTLGELCFNTGMTGYQETLTDPSYAGQIITFTFPHIGNVGTNAEDVEARQPFARGLVLRNSITELSNWRGEQHLGEWLMQHEITGICGIDTRALTALLRDQGPQNAMILSGEVLTSLEPEMLAEEVRAHPGLEGVDLAKSVWRKAPEEWSETLWQAGKGFGKQASPRFHIVAIDYGQKHNIARHLASIGGRVTIVPGDMPAREILALKPDGVFLSNGPGDPAATASYAAPIIRELIESELPVFGICLGHQLLALTLGLQTRKMERGHRGANQPVQDLLTGKVEITSQNHGFVVEEEGLPPDVEITHRSLFDGTVEGLRLKNKPVFAVQHHPEASPGPHDSDYLFQRFASYMQQYKAGM